MSGANRFYPATQADLMAVRAVLEAIGVSPDGAGLEQTPLRFLSAMKEMTAGYLVDPHELLTTAFDSPHTDQMVVVTGIEFFSVCEHHLLPFFGTAHVAYLPKERVVGLSKIPRLVECFARRLQIQERLAQQVAQALMEAAIAPVGVGVVMQAAHLCMGCRGVRQPDARMTTSVMLGAFRSKPEARAEFLQLIANR